MRQILQTDLVTRDATIRVHLGLSIRLRFMDTAGWSFWINRRSVQCVEALI